MTTGLLTMNSYVPALRSGSSSFSRGESSLESVSGNFNNLRTNDHKFTRLAVPKCALKTKRGPKQQKDGSSTNPTSLDAAIAETKQQASLMAAVAAASLSKAPEAIPRLGNTLKSLTRPKRFQAALRRVGKTRHVGAALANVAESFLTLLEPDTHPFYANMGIQLMDNFAPVGEECPPTFGLEVTGKIPECLNGIYLRNGSNPQFMPTGGYHVFDGDGMIHAVRIKDGVPSYCCRFTHTQRYLKVNSSVSLINFLKAANYLLPNFIILKLGIEFWSFP